MSEEQSTTQYQPSESSTNAYGKLYAKLQKEYGAKLSESESLLHEFEDIRKDYLAYTNRINSLLDVLFFLTEVLHRDDENNDGVDYKQKLVNKQEEITKDKNRIKELIDRYPELESLKGVLNDDVDQFKDLENYKNLLLMNHPYASYNSSESLVDWVDSLGILDFNGKKRTLEDDVPDSKSGNGTKKRKN